MTLIDSKTDHDHVVRLQHIALEAFQNHVNDMSPEELQAMNLKPETRNLKHSS